LLELTGDSFYTNLDIKIAAYDDRAESLQVLESLNVPSQYIEDIANGKWGGGYLSDFDRIHLYTHSYQNLMRSSSVVKLNMCFVLLHELRHAYQRSFFRGIMDAENHLYYAGKMDYTDMWIEADANYFAAELMRSRKCEIESILNIYESWSIDPFPYIPKPDEANLLCRSVSA
jgi:hypothetical protein